MCSAAAKAVRDHVLCAALIDTAHTSLPPRRLRGEPTAAVSSPSPSGTTLASPPELCQRKGACFLALFKVFSRKGCACRRCRGCLSFARMRSSGQPRDGTAAELPELTKPSIFQRQQAVRQRCLHKPMLVFVLAMNDCCASTAMRPNSGTSRLHVRHGASFRLPGQVRAERHKPAVSRQPRYIRPLELRNMRRYGTRLRRMPERLLYRPGERN